MARRGSARAGLFLVVPSRRLRNHPGGAKPPDRPVPRSATFPGNPPAAQCGKKTRAPIELNRETTPTRVNSLASSGTIGLDRLLDNLSFGLQSRGRADGTGRVTAWCCGAFPRLADGGGDRAVDWEGTLANLELGADLRLRPGILAGLSLSRSTGAFDYRAGTGSSRAGGKYELEMIGVHPYAAWAVARGVKLWATVGFARGELRREEDRSGGRKPRSATLGSGAAGVSARLFEHQGSTVKLKGEAGLGRFDVAAGGAGLEEAVSALQRLRLAAEASHEHVLPTGQSLTPRAELGLRYDGGDGATGTGVELGGGLRFRDPGTGWAVDGFARRLMTRGGSLPREWGFGASLGFDPGPSGRGPSARLTQSWGRSASGLHRLWEKEVGTSAARPESRLELELGYGFAAFGGRGVVTPFGAVTLDGGSRRSYRAGARLEAGPGASLSIEAERREPRDGAPGHAALLRGRLRF